MEVKLDKRYPVAAAIDQAWTVLSDIRATAACMPGAQITEQLDDTHFKGTVKSKVGPASLTFGGDIELQGIDVAAKELKMMGKGADKSGSSATMNLVAHLEPGDAAGSSVLVGRATIVVSGKLAQFGSRLLVPVSDAILAQFAGNFSNAAAAVPLPAAGESSVEGSAQDRAEDSAQDKVAQARATGEGMPPAPRAVAVPQVKELNALALMWTVIKGWFAGLFGGKKG